MELDKVELMAAAAAAAGGGGGKSRNSFSRRS
jgi:hypothetical protein